MRVIFAILMLSVGLTGCYVPNKLYREPEHSLIQVPPPPPSLPISEQQPDGPPCTAQSLKLRPCLAFVEFDDMGEKWSQESQPVGAGVTIDNTSQLSNAIKIIRSAVQQDPNALIVTFTHGWKHNAAVDDANIQGFKQVLDDFHDNRYKNHVVVGVYLSWRGDLISKYSPVRRTFSYFNREAAATRIPGASFTDALIRIANAAHSVHGATAEQRPLVVFVGHSFGGLALERALTQATVHEVDAGLAAGETPQFQQLADLVIFVNSAGAATEAKQTLDLFAANHLIYNADGHPDMPLFISVSSSSDLATKLAMPIGHGLPFLEYKARGGLRDKDPLACFDPHSSDPADAQSNFLIPAPSQGAFFMSTAAHMEILQSHEVVEETDPVKRKQCDVHNYPGEHVLFTYALPESARCFRVREKPHRCNGTPYWIMEIDPSIVPDHGTIFTDRFIAFLSNFMPTSAELDQNVRPALMKAR